jgi:hypothetical protein
MEPRVVDFKSGWDGWVTKVILEFADECLRRRKDGIHLSEQDSDPP